MFYEISFSRFFSKAKQIHKKPYVGNWWGQLRNANNMVTLNIVVEIPQSLDSIIIPLQLPLPAAAVVYIVSDEVGSCGGEGLSSSPRDGNLRAAAATLHSSPTYSHRL